MTPSPIASLDVHPTDTITDGLKRLVRDRLASYKAPSEFEFVDKFEMTSSGKINRKVPRPREQRAAAD